MKFCKLFVLLSALFVHCRCEEKIDQETQGKEENRSGKQLIDQSEHGGWRTVHLPSSNEWTPKEEKPIAVNEYLDSPPRRRRIRKRKRRPSVENLPQRQLPSHTLDDVEEKWMEMEDESVKLPHSRRRVVPTYLSELEQQEDISTLYEKVRDPFTALEEAEAKSRLKKKSETMENTTVSNLKNILKQSGGSLNLSELLQRKNLSLSDLLNGKHHAINALTEKTESSTDTVTFSSTIANLDSSSLAVEARYKPKIRGQNPRISEIEQTTERKLFVPTFAKIIPFHYKHSTVRMTSTSGPVTVSAVTKNNTRGKLSDRRTKYGSLGTKLQNHQNVTTQIPLQAFTIDLQELFGFSQLVQNRNTSTDAPYRMKIDMDDIRTSTEFEKLRPTSAREEIMEVLKDDRSKQNLSRILLLRNMTVEELVAQRERGSSQVHLADIFHNQTREPEPPSEPYVGIISEHGGRKSKTLHGSNELLDRGTGSSDDNSKPGYAVTSFPTYKIAREKLSYQNQTAPVQVWKTLYPILYTVNSSKSLERKEILSESKASVDEVLRNDVHVVENVENTISEAGNHKLNVEIIENNSYEDENSFMRLPSGVKSAIIASAALVAVSLLVFLTILIICKWSNKKKKRLCYSDVYSGSKIKSPILETRPKRTIRTIMNETLGKHKSYSNVYPQNISDYFWESDKKPFQ
ncbi:uncharacterized protein LOC116174680 [Photinus pyralis]|uniref:uncharacterized protein LOC116174680 n=1 Tax=Photinus pyralis TaxID=7054 RepID=UPI001266FECD|nr:uncharacterized protein LOC116174680 [Photinus pyralis]